MKKHSLQKHKPDKDTQMYLGSLLKNLDKNKDNKVTRAEWIAEVSKDPILVSALFKETPLASLTPELVES